MQNDTKQAPKESDLALRARIEGLITRDPVFGCWRWDRSKLDRWGYATLWTGAGPRQAHRVVYLEHVGAIGADLKLDHLCRRRDCVRPAHLEPVTEQENQRRRDPGYLARRRRCANGHPLDAPIRTPEGGLLCRECQGPERAARVVEAWRQPRGEGDGRHVVAIANHPLARRRDDDGDEGEP